MKIYFAKKGRSFRASGWKTLVGVIICTIGLSRASNPLCADDGGSGDIAVSSQVMKSYQRVHESNGSLAKESYFFEEGGIWKGDAADGSLDNLNANEVAKRLVGPLKKQNYIPAKTPADADLMIKMFWGSTQKNSGSMSQQQGVADDYRNAVMMGYENELRKFYDFRGTALAWRSLNTMQELHDSSAGRYFVILVAYDNAFYQKTKKEKLCWMTRFSFSGRRIAFDQTLATMAYKASSFFGQQSKGLVHRSLPTGKIEEGELKVLENAP